jgi:hypothetical protein
MQTFDRLIALHDLDFALFDYFPQLQNDVKIYGQTAVQTNKFRAGCAKIRFERAAARRHKRQIESVLFGVAANVQRLYFRSAASQRIERVQNF